MTAPTVVESGPLATKVVSPEGPPPALRGRHPWVALLSVALVAAVVGFAAGHVVDFGAAGAMPAESSVDVGFLRDMADHHDQAVRLALLELDRGESPALKGMALDVIALQRHEIGLMEARLIDWRHGRGDLPRQGMAWMGMATPIDRMPGMASEADLASLAAADGAAADRSFIRLMTAHHVGGIHMAEHAVQHARTPEVRDLAERIAKTQQLEVVDLSRAAAQLAEQDER